MRNAAVKRDEARPSRLLRGRLLVWAVCLLIPLESAASSVSDPSQLVALSQGGDVALQVYYDRHELDESVMAEARNTADADFQHRCAFGARHELLWGPVRENIPGW